MKATYVAPEILVDNSVAEGVYAASGGGTANVTGPGTVIGGDNAGWGMKQWPVVLSGFENQTGTLVLTVTFNATNVTAVDGGTATSVDLRGDVSGSTARLTYWDAAAAQAEGQFYVRAQVEGGGIDSLEIVSITASVG